MSFALPVVRHSQSLVLCRNIMIIISAYETGHFHQLQTFNVSVWSWSLPSSERACIQTCTTACTMIIILLFSFRIENLGIFWDFFFCVVQFIYNMHF